MKITFFFIFLLFAGAGLKAQDEQAIMNVFARICLTDSISSTLAHLEDDSSITYYFKTPDVNKFGLLTYDFKEFNIIFDTGSNLLFKGLPYGAIEEMDFKKKKATIRLRIEGAGSDRKKQGNFEKAVYTFVYKDYKWLLNGVDYY